MNTGDRARLAKNGLSLFRMFNACASKTQEEHIKLPAEILDIAENAWSTIFSFRKEKRGFTGAGEIFKNGKSNEYDGVYLVPA